MITQLILDILTWLSLTVVGILALAQLRDLLLQFGFLSRDSWLGRQASRGQTNQVVAGLEALGLDDRIARSIRASLSPPKRRLERALNASASREDVVFLTLAKAWIYRLDAPYNYKGASYYLDIMGAISSPPVGTHRLDQVFAQWIVRAASYEQCDLPDAFLAPKDGNVLLCQAVAERFNLPLILCKGERDNSLVDRADPTEPHVTDFEGLQAFLTANKSKARLHGHRYSFWVIDDSCSGGSQIVSLIRRFKRWVELTVAETGWDVSSIDTVFVLFRATARSPKGDALSGNGLKLHALVSLGENELASLSRLSPKKICKRMAEFKLDEFACEVSLKTFKPNDDSSQKRALKCRVPNRTRAPERSAD